MGFTAQVEEKLYPYRQKMLSSARHKDWYTLLVEDPTYKTRQSTSHPSKSYKQVILELDKFLKSIIFLKEIS